VDRVLQGSYPRWETAFNSLENAGIRPKKVVQSDTVDTISVQKPQRILN